MEVFNTWWFWILVLASIVFIIAFSSYEALSNTWTSDTGAPVPYWIWVLFGLGFVLLIIGGILLWRKLSYDYNKMRQDIACGKVAPPSEVVVCPPDPCDPTQAQKQVLIQEGPHYTTLPPCPKQHVHPTYVSQQTTYPSQQTAYPSQQTTYPPQQTAYTSQAEVVYVQVPESTKTAIPASALNTVFG